MRDIDNLEVHLERSTSLISTYFYPNLFIWDNTMPDQPRQIGTVVLYQCTTFPNTFLHSAQACPALVATDLG